MGLLNVLYGERPNAFFSFERSLRFTRRVLYLFVTYRQKTSGRPASVTDFRIQVDGDFFSDRTAEVLDATERTLDAGGANFQRVLALDRFIEILAIDEQLARDDATIEIDSATVDLVDVETENTIMRLPLGFHTLHVGGGENRID